MWLADFCICREKLLQFCVYPYRESQTCGCYTTEPTVAGRLLDGLSCLSAEKKLRVGRDEQCDGRLISLYMGCLLWQKVLISPRWSPFNSGGLWAHAAPSIDYQVVRIQHQHNCPFFIKSSWCVMNSCHMTGNEVRHHSYSVRYIIDLLHTCNWLNRILWMEEKKELVWLVN